VLRLYVFLMVVAPAYVWLASKRYWYPLVPAAAVWLVSGHFGLASRDSLTGELLSMTVLPWQLVFAAGISLAAAIGQQAPLPRARGLVAGAAAIVAGGTLLLVLGPHASSAVQAWLDTRNEFFWTGISKSYQSPLRLLYLVALAYLFMAWRGAPLIRLFHNAAPDTLLCRLGRNSLQVFTFGAIFALAIDQLLWNLAAADVFALRSMGAVALEVILAGIGLALMSRIADRRRAAATARPALKPATL
jgi:hypothetical protein